MNLLQSKCFKKNSWKLTKNMLSLAMSVMPQYLSANFSALSSAG